MFSVFWFRVLFSNDQPLEISNNSIVITLKSLAQELFSVIVYLLSQNNVRLVKCYCLFNSHVIISNILSFIAVVTFVSLIHKRHVQVRLLPQRSRNCRNIVCLLCLGIERQSLI